MNKHISAIHKVKFSPDEKYILTAAYDNTIKLWDLEGNLLANLNKHEGYSSRISFSSDSQFIITQATTLKIWPTPQAIYQYLEDEPLPLLTEEKLKKYGMK